MKRLLPILIALAVVLGLCACGAADRAEENSGVAPISDTQLEEQSPQAYIPPNDLSVEETIEAYFDQQYTAYTELSYIDISGILDMRQRTNQNMLIWLQTLIQRRRLLDENNLCYVDTNRYPYTINYIAEDELEDERLDYWRSLKIGLEDEMLVHFVITGTLGTAYPPMFAVNSQHTIRLKKVSGMWKIVMHYYPGAVRKFYRNFQLELADEQEMLKGLQEEFRTYQAAEPSDIPASAKPYSGQNAAIYARAFTETNNPAFYDVGDWMGNCANFTSQCIWYGFGDGQLFDSDPQGNMTREWYAGGGGGSPAWENVSHFWEYAVGGNQLKCEELPGARALRAGDMIQVRANSAAEDDEDEAKYNHSLLVIDERTMLLGQNSPDCFVYYSDLVNVEARFLRPLYLENSDR